MAAATSLEGGVSVVCSRIRVSQGSFCYSTLRGGNVVVGTGMKLTLSAVPDV